MVVVLLLIVLACLLTGVGLVVRAVVGSPVQYANVAYAGEIVPLPHGQLLVTDFGFLDRTRAQVLIADRRGRLLWRFKGRLVNPHSAYPTTDGKILISDTGDNRVIEVDRASHIVWDTDDLGGGHGRLGQGRISDGRRLDYPNDAKLLPNGTIMISCRLQNRVIAITRSGHIVWTVGGFLNRQHNPDMLSNGDLLIADSGWNRVIEVNRHGRILWQFGSPHLASAVLAARRQSASQRKHPHHRLGLQSHHRSDEVKAYRSLLDRSSAAIFVGLAAQRRHSSW